MKPATSGAGKQKEANMKVKSFQKMSLIDYSPHVAVVVFTGGCSFRCGYCYNPDLVITHAELPDIPEDEILAYVDQNRTFIDGVCVTGGEPCIHSDLPDFLAKLKERDLLVKVNTNGTRPGMVKKILDARLVDRFAMDIKSAASNYPAVAGVNVDMDKIRESIALIMGSGLEYEFHATPIPGLVGEAEAAGVGELVKGAGVIYVNKFDSSRGCIDSALTGVPPATDAETERFKDILTEYVERVEVL